MMWGWWGGGPGGWGWVSMLFIMAIFWAAIILFGVWAVKTLAGSHGSRSDGPRSSDESAIEILRRRYASGEIDQQEFESKLKVLGR